MEESWFMNVKCNVSGGFMGLSKECRFSSDDLSEEELNSLNQLKNLDTKKASSANLKDGFLYQFEIKSGNEVKKVSISEEDVSSSLFPLIDRVDKLLM